MASRRNPAGLVKLKLKARHPSQQKVIREAKRWNVLCCGRRWGKTDLFLDLAVDGKSPGDPASILNGGKVGWWVGREDLFEEVWTEVSQALEPITVRSNANQHQLWIAGGGSIKFWSNGRSDTHNQGRGRKYHRAIIDEAAFNPQLEKAWERTIRPTLMDFRGDAWFGSSPKGMGYFKRLVEMGQTDSAYYRPGFMSWVYSSRSNPYIDPAEIEALRNEMSDSNFRQEIEAEFIEGAGGWFKREWIKRYTTAIDGRDMNIVILVDPASGISQVDGEDYTAIWVVGLGIDGNYYVLDFVRERYDLVQRTDAVFALVRRWNPITVGYERYGKDSDIQHIEYVMNQQNYRFNITTLGGPTSKEKRIERLVPLFKLGRMYLPGMQISEPMVQQTHAALALWIDTEYVDYPNSPHDDGLDGLARIFDVGVGFPNQQPSEVEQRQKEALIQQRPRMRSSLQGHY